MSDVRFDRVSLVEACPRASAFSPMRVPMAQKEEPEPAPVEAAGPDHYALGYAAGERAARVQSEAERAALLQLLAAATALQPEPSEELAAMISVTVERLVTEIVGRMPVDKAWLAGRIDQAMHCIGEADAARTLWLHPDDAALLGDANLAVDIQTDAGLERGALRIDCSRGWVEDSRSVHLEALRAMLGVEDRP